MGVRSKEDWLGFIEVWREASALNRIVIDALGEAGISAISFPPSASVSAQNREITQWNIAPIERAAAAGILPVIYGDVLFDDRLGGTIFSTEELFAHLAERLKPERILLVGLEPGVWERYPQRTRLIPKITPQSFLQQDDEISGSAATDVTGGMYGKVQYSLAMIDTNPGLEISIFSGEQPGSIIRALAGEKPGTLICAD
jgi:isopentenyl phosphate kinase